MSLHGYFINVASWLFYKCLFIPILSISVSFLLILLKLCIFRFFSLLRLVLTLLNSILLIISFELCSLFVVARSLVIIKVVYFLLKYDLETNQFFMTSRILGSPFKSPGGPILSRGSKTPSGSDGIPNSLEQSANSQSGGSSTSSSMRLQVPERSRGGIRTLDDSIDDKNPGEIINPVAGVLVTPARTLGTRSSARTLGSGTPARTLGTKTQEPILSQSNGDAPKLLPQSESRSPDFSPTPMRERTIFQESATKSPKFDEMGVKMPGSRLILGLRPSHESPSQSLRSKSTTPDSRPEIPEEIECPMCGESMVSLLQLNQHIDDAHVIRDEERSQQKSQRHPRKTVNLDLLDGNRGFSLSDQLGPRSAEGELSQRQRNSALLSPGSARSNATAPSISRSHWKHPSSTSTCSYPSCSTLLGVKNGVVNCRKCGSLFCNVHTHYKVRLANGESDTLPVYDSAGVWSRCCYNCYKNKPDLKLGTQANSRDLTRTFVKMRQLVVDDQLLYRNKIQKRFIKLSGILVDQPPPLWFSINTPRHGLGNDTWDDDATTLYCTVCFVKFNLLIRKHHCRLCGKIVCDDPLAQRQSCSINVPLGRLVEKLENLNYPPKVKQSITTLIKDESIRFRCCVNCKNALLHDFKLNSLKTLTVEEENIFNTYSVIMTLKQHIQLLLPRYEKLVEDADDEPFINKLRIKLMKFFKEFEIHTVQFKNRFFVASNNRLQVGQKYAQHSALINNMYQSLIIFLQESLLLYKMLNDQFKAREEKILKLQQAESQPVASPRLTKKQIRELREQLMVMNEQKFMVENLIVDYTKLRKFDELESLIENKTELGKIIDDLEAQLGEFGF